MKVLLIGAFSIIWWQNSCAAPKWTGAATGDNYGDDLDLHMDMDFLDMELDMTDTEHDYNDDLDLDLDLDFTDLELDTIDTEHDNDRPSPYNSFPEKGPQQVIVEPMKCSVKPPSLLWIGFTCLRLLIAVWYLSLLASLSVKKPVISVGPEDSERPLVNGDGVGNDARDIDDDMDEVEDVEAVLEDLLKAVVNAVDAVDGDMDVVEDVTAVLEDVLQVVVLVHALDQDEDREGAAFQLNPIDEQETGDGSSAKPSETDDLLPNPIVTDTTTVRDPKQDLLDEIGKRSEDSDWTESSSSVRVSSSDSSMMSMETIRKQFLSKPEKVDGPGCGDTSGEAVQQPKNTEKPPFSQKAMLTKKEWLAIQNWMWAREPDGPFGHQPKVSFTEQVEVKTFLVKKPMHPYDPEEGPSEVTQVEPLKREGEFQELGLLLTRKCIRHRLLRGISKLKGAFRKKSAP